MLAALSGRIKNLPSSVMGVSSVETARVSAALPRSDGWQVLTTWRTNKRRAW